MKKNGILFQKGYDVGLKSTTGKSSLSVDSCVKPQISAINRNIFITLIYSRAKLCQYRRALEREAFLL